MLHSMTQKRGRGFSLIELIIVVAMIMILAAISVPRLLNTVSDINLRYAATNISGLLQAARMQGVRKNTFYTVQPTTLSTGGTGALNGGNADSHLASLGQGTFASGGNGAALYTSSTAPAGYNVGDIDWSQATPTLATSTTAGYAMMYQTCSGDIYEVRWNIMDANNPAPTLPAVSRISLLTVSSRETAAKGSKLGMLFAPPTTLRTLIESSQF